MKAPGRLFRVLLRAYPRPFRRLYGREMEEAFQAGWADAGAGPARRLSFLLRTALDTVRTGLGERFRAGGYRTGRSGLRVPRRGVATLVRDLWQDTRYAVRTLGRTPGYVAVLAVTVALGLGANTAIFSVAYGVLGRPLPFENGPRVVRLVQERPGFDANASGTREVPLSVHELQDYRGVEALEEVAEYHRMSFTLQTPDGPRRVGAGVVSANFFSFLGMDPLHGRLFRTEEDELGADPVIVLSHGFWQEVFTGDPSVVGTILRMNGADHRVVGILPPIPQFPDRNEIYLPVSVCPTRSSANFIGDRGARLMTAYARLDRGGDLREAQTAVAALASRFQEAHPEAYDFAGGFAADVVPLDEELVRQARPVMIALVGIAVLLLVISCANAASLALARASRRWEQASIRTALGASRGRMFRQHLTEGVLVALAGGVLGLGVALVGHGLLADFAARLTTRAQQIRVDETVLAFALVASLLTGATLGMAPLAAMRDPSTLHWNRRSPGDSGLARRWQRRLVVLQVAVAFVVLSGAGLMLRSFWAVSARDTGFVTESVVTARIALDESRYATWEDAEAFLAGVVHGLEAHPGVEEVTRLPWAPLSEHHEHRSALSLQAPGGDEWTPAVGDVRPADPSTFRVLGIPVLQGRGVEPEDTADGPLVAVVNETFRRRHMAGRFPLGTRIRSCDGQEPCSPVRTIVGIVGDATTNGVESEVIPEVYIPAAQSDWLREVVAARITGDPGPVQEALVSLVRSRDPGVPLEDVATLADFRRENLAPRRFVTALIVLFALIAGGLALAGVFGVTHLMAAARLREMGVRRALGARPGDITRAVLGEGARLVGVGLLAGSLLVWWTNGLLSSFLWNVDAHDPLTHLTATLLFMGAGALAAAIPARRAAREDVMQTLTAP